MFPIKYEGERLVGVGIRKKYFINIYAYGIYVDAPSLRKHKADNAMNSLNQTQVIKSIRMVFARKMKAKVLSEAFAQSLEPRIGLLKEEADLAKKNLVAFKSLWSQVNQVEKGVEVMIRWNGEDLAVWMDGKAFGEVKNASPLAWALFDCYIGPQSVNASAQKTILTNVTQLISHRIPSAL